MISVASASNKGPMNQRQLACEDVSVLQVMDLYILRDSTLSINR
jgi:hypothetical protein